MIFFLDQNHVRCGGEPSQQHQILILLCPPSPPGSSPKLTHRKGHQSNPWVTPDRSAAEHAIKLFERLWDSWARVKQKKMSGLRFFFCCGCRSPPIKGARSRSPLILIAPHGRVQLPHILSIYNSPVIWTSPPFFKSEINEWGSGGEGWDGPLFKKGPPPKKKFFQADDKSSENRNTHNLIRTLEVVADIHHMYIFCE